MSNKYDLENVHEMITWMLSNLFNFISSISWVCINIKNILHARFPSGVHLFSKQLHIQGSKRLNPQLTTRTLKWRCNPFYDLVFLLLLFFFSLLSFQSHIHLLCSHSDHTWPWCCRGVTLLIFFLQQRKKQWKNKFIFIFLNQGILGIAWYTYFLDMSKAGWLLVQCF